MDKKPEAQKVKLLLYLLGRKGREIHSTIQFQTTDEHGNKVDIEEKNITVKMVLDEFDKHCDPKKNETVERYKFYSRSQQVGDTFDKFLAEIRILADTCNFGTLKDSMIRDRIICGVSDSGLRERLLRVADLDLDKCIQVCRATEVSKEQNKEIEPQAAGASVHTVNSHKKNFKKQPQKPQRHQQQQQNRQDSSQCKYCGSRHVKGKRNCKAYGHQCGKCGKLHHFEKVCNSTKSSVHQIQESVESDSDDYYSIYSVDLRNLSESINAINQATENKVFATLSVNGQYVKFQVDSGATCNILPHKYLSDKNIITKTDQILSMYNNTTIKPLGKCHLKFTNPKNGGKYKADFVVLDGPCQPILGSKASQALKLITVENENILELSMKKTEALTREKVCSKFQDVFTGLGLLEGDYHLQLDPNAKPVIHAPRKVPLAIKKDLENELERLVKLRILAKVTEPTPWVSSLVVARKPSGKLRVCIDPQDLNKGLQRAHYPMPTIDDILPDLSDAKCFSVLDAKDGFWHVRLDYESSLMTTFNSPFGRFRWLRMPFGINTAPEEFQRRQHQALEGLPGVKSIHDDILVIGEGKTVAEAQEDHDRNFMRLMERCREKQLKLNKDKMKFRQSQVKFIGHTITAEGLKADPEKVKAVLDMPNPTDVAGVRRFIGFVTYLAKFLPKLSDICEPLRKLTQKDIEWHWTSEHDNAVRQVKKFSHNRSGIVVL